jgi:hypothetical protein
MTTAAGAGAVEMNDSYRAEKKSSFAYTDEQLKKIIDLYKERKYVEELEYIDRDLEGIT